MDQGYNIYEAELLSASIPNCLYNVTNNNNTFNFSDTGGTHNIIIPIGMYNITQLCIYLQTQMNTFLTQTYTVSYDSSSNRVEFSATDVFSLLFTDSNIAILLGFNLQNYSGNTNYTSSGGSQINQNDYLYLNINEFTTP